MLRAKRTACNRARIEPGAEEKRIEFVYPPLLASEEVRLECYRLQHAERERLCSSLSPCGLQADGMMGAVIEMVAMDVPTHRDIDCRPDVNAARGNVCDRVDALGFHCESLACQY